MDTELDRILADDYLASLPDRPVAELRALRAECQTVETQLSYLRRMVQGRHDIVTGEIDRRGHGGDRYDVSDLVDRLPEVSAWAQRVLDGLMGDDDSSARLRDTLLTFLDAQGSYTDAAARMHVHKNTVHYRIRKAEEILGRSVAHNRLETELALTICAQLGLDGAS